MVDLPRKCCELPGRPTIAFLQRSLILAACLLPTHPALGAGVGGEWLSDGRYVMGTILEIQIEGDVRLLEQAFAHALRLDRLFTTYDPKSPLSQLNRGAGTDPKAVDPDLFRILADARSYAELTAGAFDITVGPLVRLWRAAVEQGRMPRRRALEDARRSVGSHRIRLQEDGRVELPDAGMSLDLGGLAKGWALDRIGEVLRRAGVTRALLSFGESSILALGGPPEERPGATWRLLLEAGGGGPPMLIALRDQSLSVSSGFTRVSRVEGQDVGHIVDPRTGRPVNVSRRSAVVAPSGALAEALSTALLVLDDTRGLELLESLPGTEGAVTDASGRRWATRGWSRAVGETGPPASSAGVTAPRSPR